MAITVTYWNGTTQETETVTTYKQAMKIAARNNNAYGPSFEDSEGNELVDDGNGLMYVDGPVNGCDYAC